MPLYNVEHSYPLTSPQKQQIAEAITKLHTTKFLAPSLFVHVKFSSSDASIGNYFLAGKPRTSSTNRIVAYVRTSNSRTKKHWDELAKSIEDAWYTAVSGEIVEEGKDKGKREKAVDDNASVTEAKNLNVVAFVGAAAVWENGHEVPLAGEEAAWLKDHHDEFQRRADGGDELYKDLLEEVSTREDLKKAYSL